MNLRSLFKKRNYLYLYNKYKSYPSTVNSFPNDYSEYESFKDILKYIAVENFEKVVAVASGPTAKNIEYNDKYLYFCTNNSIELVKNKVNYIYTVSDEFYLYKYLNSFKEDQYWVSTFFYFYLNSASESKKNDISKYLTNNSRSRKEFLITNEKNSFNSDKINSDIKEVFVKWKYNHFGVNSGFNNLVLSSIVANFANLPLVSYGLDMGEGGQYYFNKPSSLGRSIKGDFSKAKVTEFLKVLNNEVTFENNSNFK
ncbi:MAG: hypothetical protein CMP12_20455 [Zunongwangia sp.]|uniref:hypothetical protein n=1 Tax=Zunongwangia profunda TaxID=398743 RepID=UPI000C3E5AC2|nr:hypothetical protein [Zunongwangia profunda]MAO38232.1 hypothetical protein [Zunongwangia sp.]MAS69318.1 hypothetical protein [Zunongwangia sp.]MAS69554.1 hypothetical protein [Zunongwangia sp.]|tara:strand:- start:8347 stop:9111 length:765 start_codon:yes stop_codon:yes gene_type:complete